MTAPRLVVILGSGEITPGMAPIHRRILERLPAGARAVMLDTPYGFQENAADLTAKIGDYFATRFDVKLGVATLRDALTASDAERERFAAAVEAAAYVFAGPGSPTYALRHWAATPLPGLLREKLRGGGVAVFASAAAITLGVASLPVYEIYKVGAPCHWMEGLDVLGAAGIRCTVIPHFDNAEGGSHDTRFCYMGERRLRLLETMLDPGTLVLGVDEHTAVVMDLDANTVAVSGRGGMTLRRNGEERVVASGSVISLDELRDGAATPPTVTGAPSATASDGASASAAAADPPAFAAAADTALTGRDVDALIEALLGLEGLAATGVAEARDALRRRIARLGELVTPASNSADVAPFVDALLALRGRARAERRFDEADGVREILSACGVEVRDTPEGAQWEIVATGR